MGNSETRTTVTHCILLLAVAAKPNSTTVIVTAYDGTGIVKQQPLTLGCNYTKDAIDVITGFEWRHGRDVIVSGSVTDKNERFQLGTEWESGVFLGNYTSSLTIQLPASSVTPSIAGQYTCTVSGSGAAHDTATSTVQYLDRPELLVNRTEVVENETVSLTCNVESSPTAQLVIKNVDNNTILVTRDSNRLQFTIDRVQCLHNGSFLCTARNTQIENASNSALREINVKCSPRQDFRHKRDNTVVKHIHETAALVADVIANPVPEFRWFRQESEGRTNISRDTIHSISNSHLQSVLFINISRTQDYGDYVLEMENSQGRKRLLFTLTSKDSEKSLDEEGSILPIVVGIISAVVVVAVFIVGVFLYRRKQKGLDCFKRKSEVSDKIEMTENQVYESSTANAGAIYAQPNKQKKSNTKDVDYENAKTGRDNGGLQADTNVKKQVLKVGLDEDGLTYVQIDTTNQKPAKNTKPRTAPRPTAYATISYGQVGDPLPDEEEKE